jgi:arylsulfatase A-like enzyme
VPFLVSWPGTIDAGSRNDDLLVLTDLLPTIGELVGAGRPAVDGTSRLRGWLGRRDEAAEEAAEEPAVIHHSYYGMFAVRRGRWKYIEQLGSGGSAKPGRVIPKGADPADWPPLVVPHPDAPAGQLYDMIEDPQERRNLWSERRDAVAELHAELERVRGDDAEPMSEEVLPAGERAKRR